MRISSRNVHKECNKSSDSITLEDSRDVSQSIIEEGSENYTSPTKGNVDDAYTLLLSKNESEQKIKVAINFLFIYLIFRRKKSKKKGSIYQIFLCLQVPVFDKIKHKFGMILGNPNFRGIFSPATLGAV